jgi:cysteine synthase
MNSIIVGSENDPARPEFPPDNPRFPASSSYKIRVPWFPNVWLKDESTNLTGTHKDRMAWEIVVTYQRYLVSKKRGQYKGKLPQMSIISSGSAAVSIQTLLRRYQLPNLKVLLDYTVAPLTQKYLEHIGCEVFVTDLSRKALSWKEILSLTNNPEGIDITSDEALGPTTRFYDWMSYEIVNLSPNYCFIPFGSGQLYENVLNVNAAEVATTRHDPRFSGDVTVLRKCNFMGATTNNPKSKADKLYSHHLPFAHASEQWIRSYRFAQSCGDDTGVYVIKESFLEEAMELANQQGIACEYSGIAGLALMLQMAEHIPKESKIVIVNTGKTKMSPDRTVPLRQDSKRTATHKRAAASGIPSETAAVTEEIQMKII